MMPRVCSLALGATGHLDCFLVFRNRLLKLARAFVADAKIVVKRPIVGTGKCQGQKSGLARELGRLHRSKVAIEPIKAFLYYWLSGRKMPRVECYMALIRTRHTQESKQRILR
jgi:hypothetical protein